jgi:hypothetical protein
MRTQLLKCGRGRACRFCSSAWQARHVGERPNTSVPLEKLRAAGWRRAVSTAHARVVRHGRAPPQLVQQQAARACRQHAHRGAALGAAGTSLYTSQAPPGHAAQASSSAASSALRGGMRVPFRRAGAAAGPPGRLGFPKAVHLPSCSDTGWLRHARRTAPPRRSLCCACPAPSVPRTTARGASLARRCSARWRIRCTVSRRRARCRCTTGLRLEGCRPPRARK